MITAYPVAEIRRTEQQAIAAQPTRDLMQHAAAALATTAAAELKRAGRLPGANVLILTGPGNNGGDALFAGARLARRGVAVTAVPVLGSPHENGLSALLAAGGHLDQHPDPEAGWQLAIDGILGIGGRLGLPDQAADLVDRLHHARVPMIAVDLPSGVDAERGAVPGRAVQAAATVSFGAPKPSELIEPARAHCGRIVRVDLGFEFSGTQPRLEMITESDIARRWPYPNERSDKYSRGVVGIDAGSATYPGAAIMATHGAVFTGAGMVRFLGTDEARRALSTMLPNVVYANGRVQAWLYGSGWGDRNDATKIIADAVRAGLPVVVDADALSQLPPDGVPASWLLTPHAGELARLLGCSRDEIEADPVQAAHRGADQTGASVLLKGATQVVARPGNASVLIAAPGPAWTAQAGSGDVLAGMCATLLAAGIEAAEAGALAASLQALAAAENPGPLPPHRLVERAAQLLGRLGAQPAKGESTAHGR